MDLNQFSRGAEANRVAYNVFASTTQGEVIGSLKCNALRSAEADTFVLRSSFKITVHDHFIKETGKIDRLSVSRGVSHLEAGKRHELFDQAIDQVDIPVLPVE
jgi:hypothetical protein